MAIKSKWGARLQQSKSAWKQSEEAYKEAFGAEKLPEDVYVVKLQECEIKESQSKKLMIHREHVILEGEFKGIVVRDNLMLENEWGPVFVRRWLEMLGVEVPDDPAELEEVIAAIKEAAPLCKIRVRKADGFTNVDVLSVVGDDETSADASGAGDTGQEIDLDAMDKEALRALIKDNDLDIDGWRKMDETALRAAITAAIGGDASGTEAIAEEQGIDLDSLDKAGLLQLVADNDIDFSALGFKNKLMLKSAKEEVLRKALEKYVAESGAEGAGGTNEDDELLEQAKVFCGTWDVKIAEDADLEAIKKAMAACQFPEKELDDDEKALLAKLELESTIQKAKAIALKAPAVPAAGKKVLKLGKK